MADLVNLGECTLGGYTTVGTRVGELNYTGDNHQPFSPNLKESYPSYFKDIKRDFFYEQCTIGPANYSGAEYTAKFVLEGFRQKQSGVYVGIIKETELSVSFRPKLTEWGEGHYVITKFSHGNMSELLGVQSDYHESNGQVNLINPLESAIELASLALITGERLSCYEPAPRTSALISYNHQYTKRLSLENFVDPTLERVEQLAGEFSAFKKEICDSEEFQELCNELAAGLQVLYLTALQHWRKADYPAIKIRKREHLPDLDPELAAQFEADSQNRSQENSLTTLVKQLTYPGKVISHAREIRQAERGLRSADWLIDAVFERLVLIDEGLDAIRKSYPSYPALAEALQRREV